MISDCSLPGGLLFGELLLIIRFLVSEELFSTLEHDPCPFEGVTFVKMNLLLSEDFMVLLKSLILLECAVQ